jgi:hypothetical protein
VSPLASLIGGPGSSSRSLGRRAYEPLFALPLGQTRSRWPSRYVNCRSIAPPGCPQSICRPGRYNEDGRSRREPTPCCRRFRHNPSPHGGAASRARGGSGGGELQRELPINRSRSVRAGLSEISSGPGPLIGYATQLGRERDCRFRRKPLPQHLGPFSEPRFLGWCCHRNFRLGLRQHGPPRYGEGDERLVEIWVDHQGI